MTYAKKLESTRRWRADNPERAQEVVTRYQQGNREHLAKVARVRADVLRTLVFNHYGWSCACCGSTRQPTIDHVNGDGREHRAVLTGHGVGGRWLARNGFPEGFQTLCRPCNRSKGTGPACQIDHGRAA